MHAQCTESQEVAKALAAKAKETEGELAHLRWLEDNHLAELDSIKWVEQEKVDSLNQWLGEVDEKSQKLSSEMATQSKALTETAKRWVDEISALDRGLAGRSLLSIFFPSFAGFRLLAGGKNSIGSGQLEKLRISPGFRLVAGCCLLVGCRQADFLTSIISILWLVAAGVCSPAAARLVSFTSKICFFLSFPRLAADTAGRDLPAVVSRILQASHDFCCFSRLPRDTGGGAGRFRQGTGGAPARDWRKQL
jgi:hypothetical protein